MCWVDKPTAAKNSDFASKRTVSYEKSEYTKTAGENSPADFVCVTICSNLVSLLYVQDILL